MAHLQESAPDDQLVTDLDKLLEDLPEEDEKKWVQEEPEEEDDDEEEKEAAADRKREEDDVQALIERIRNLESQGRADEGIVADLERRGISRQALQRAWKQHIEDFPEHEHEAPSELLNQQSLEERVGSAPSVETGNPLYDTDLSQASDEELYDALNRAQTYIGERGGVTDREYEALNEFEQELERRREGGYQSSDVVESIKSVGALRIGDNYLRSKSRDP